ncbi:MAG: ABC transporter ATP-binding protein [Gemmobacter sp.]|jgi:peptide/nickel transport system ATP-binding protein|nr:ABC transporter ATP-binding protein [Gemmobacter sp.]
MSAACALSVSSLSVRLSRPDGEPRFILRDIGFALDRGETLGIVGESGCGKSTLLAAMLGSIGKGLQIGTGSIRLDGREIVGIDRQQLEHLRGRQIALVPQNAAQTLTPSLTIGRHFEEQLALKTDLPAAARRERAAELVATMRLPDPAAVLARYPHQLSGGQQQRIGIALALAGQPSVLLLDEPTTALDVTTKLAILDLLREIGAQEKLAMIYVSHDIGVIACMSDRIGVVYAGELVEEAQALVLLNSPRHPYAAGLLASVPRMEAQTMPEALPGTPPGPRPASAYCAFSPRCARATGLCRTQWPAQTQLTPEHRLACHHPLEPFGLRPDRPASIATIRQTANGAIQAPDIPLITVESLEIAYRKRSLADFTRGRTPQATVSDVSFTVAPGEVLGLIGESGSGKSTILRSIAGLLAPRHGEMRFAGQVLADNVACRSPDQRGRIQMIYQNPDDSLNPRQSVRQIIQRPLIWFRGLKGAELDAEVKALVDTVRLPARHAERRPGELSGGEKQRVAIARALAARPSLLLCDEITSALDVSVQAAILGLLDELRRETNVAMLFVSHDMAVIRHIADRIVILQAGRICEAGATGTIMAHPSHPYSASLIAAACGYDAYFR